MLEGLNLFCGSCTNNNTQRRYHDEERGAHGAEELGGVGGDRVDAAAPGQRVEPRLADHVQVGGDVGGGVLPVTHRGGGEGERYIRVNFEDQ